MDKRLIRAVRIIMTVMGLGIGIGVYLLGISIISELGFSIIEGWAWIRLVAAVFSAALFAIIFYLLSPKAAALILKLEQRLRSLPAKEIAFGAMGLIIGLFIAYLLSRLIEMIPVKWVSIPISVLLYIALGYTGVSVAINKREDFSWPSIFRRDGHGGDGAKISAKLLDTSVIIDGRIFDIANTGFLEGHLYIPSFVLTELRYIADSGDELKRNRGRRGLDILKKMQEELSLPVEVLDRDFDDLQDVDAKLLKLAAEMKASVVTNDYNLNKVAGVQGVHVLNINELANAVKPVALPGEVMHVKIVKEGKEQQQGVGFLADGTMIVVQDASNLIGHTLEVEVTTALQTAAGRMIFARVRE